MFILHGAPLPWQNVHRDLSDQLRSAGIRIEPYAGRFRLAVDPCLSAAELERSLSSSLGDPAHLVAWNAAAAAARLEQGEPDGALAVLAQLQPDTASPAFLDGWLAVLAYAYVATGQAREALAALSLADRFSESGQILEPDHPASNIARRAMSLLASGTDALPPPAGGWSSLRAVVRAFSVLLARQGVSLDAEVVRACARLQGDGGFAADLAQAVGRDAIRLAPDALDLGVGARFDLADHLLRANRLDEAEAWQRSALDLLPGHGGANRQLAEIISMQGRPADALPYAARAQELEPQPSHAALLSLLEAQLGRPSSPDLLAAAAAYPPDGELARVPGLSDHLRALQPEAVAG